jgi:hypothetical protein
MPDLIKLAQEYKSLNLPQCPELRRQMLVKKFSSSDDRSYQNVAVSHRGSGRKKHERSQNIA